MITNDEIQKWAENGAIITKDEYRMLETIVRDSIDRLIDTRLQGSDEFQYALEGEIDKRHELVRKLHYLFYCNER